MAHFLSAAQVAEALSQAGWPDNELITATAVCFAESSGNVESDTNPYGKGLMQINPIAHPQYDHDKLISDAVYNCQCGKEIFDTQEPRGQWSHNKWETYPVAYKAFIPQARSGVATFHKEGGGGIASGDAKDKGGGGVFGTIGGAFGDVTGAIGGAVGDVTSSVGDVAGDIASVPKFLGRLGESIFSRDFWWRVLKVIIGLGLTVLAVKLILHSTGLDTQITKAAEMAAVA